MRAYILGEATDQRGDDILAIAAHVRGECLVVDGGQHRHGHVDAHSVAGIAGGETVGERESALPDPGEVVLRGCIAQQAVGEVEKGWRGAAGPSPPRVEGPA